MINMIPQISNINKSLVALQERQDKVMTISRAAVRLSGEAVAAMHARDMKRARNKLNETTKSIAALKKIDKGFEYYSAQAHQEYVEAYSLYMILTKKVLPSSAELKEGPVNYILGVMDIVGELKREAVEELRKGDREAAELHYMLMKAIYEDTLPMRFANALMPGFRRKQDVARIQLESIEEMLQRADKNLK